jgi:SRSO17 transposase
MGFVVLLVVVSMGIQAMLLKEATASEVTFERVPAAAVYPDSRKMLVV